MKRIFIALLSCFLLAACVACNPAEVTPSPSVNPTPINLHDFEALKTRTESEILALDNVYDILTLEGLDKYYPVASYLHLLSVHTGNNINHLVLSSSDPIESGGYWVNTITELRTLEYENAKVPVICIRKISNEHLYTVHLCPDEMYVYGFFKYDDQEGCWISENKIYEASKPLAKSDFEAITTDNTLKDVLAIDPSQDKAFYYKKVLDNKFESHHVTKEGVLTITYEGEVNNKTKPEELKVKAMQWSDPLPILDKDYPQ